MRFGLAIASLVLAGIMLIVGIGQRTFLAGPREIVYSASLPTNADFAVIPVEELGGVPGQANAVVTGGEGFAAVGSNRDVAAWVAPLTHAVLAVDAKEKVLTGSAVRGEDPASDDAAGAADGTDAAAAEAADGTDAAAAEAADGDDAETADEAVFDPRGSDLWLSEQDGPGRLPLALETGQSVLVQAPSGSKVSIAWVQDFRTPLAGPLLVGGAAFAILGLVLYLLAVDHDRRGLGPRRGRRGPLPGIRGWLGGLGGRRRRGSDERASAERSSAEQRSVGHNSDASPVIDPRARRRSLAVPALGLAVVLGLSGCSASYWPDFAPAETVEEAPEESAPSSAAPVPVTQAQIDRIVTDVATVAGEADDALDAQLLESRFTGDALAQRAANYTIRAAVSDYEITLPRITDEQLDYELVQSTENWPRTIFVTVASESPGGDDEAAAEPTEGSDDASASDAEPRPASPSLAMVLTQASPHENFLMTRLFQLRGGISMPAAAPVEEGTALLAADLQGLLLPPGEVGTAYAAILAGGADDATAAAFTVEGDPVIAKSGAAWVAAAQASAAEAGNDVDYSVTAAQGERPVVSLSTGVGGALVATTVMESRIEAQTGDYQPKAVGAFEALSGLSGRQERIVSVVAHQLLFFVPSSKNASSGDRIQLLGYTSELVEATN